MNSISKLLAIVLLTYVTYASSTVPDIYDDGQNNFIDDSAPYAYNSYADPYQQQLTGKLCDCGLINNGNHGINSNDAVHMHLNGLHHYDHSYRRQHHEHPHEQFHDTAFYFHRNGVAHIHPPSAILGR